MISKQHRPNDLGVPSKALSPVKVIFIGVTKMLREMMIALLSTITFNFSKHCKLVSLKKSK